MNLENEHGLIGRTALYRLSQADVDTIFAQRHSGTNDGAIGNAVRAGELVPMVITQAWSADNVNGQAILDGNDSLWLTSVQRGNEPGEWQFL